MKLFFFLQAFFIGSLLVNSSLTFSQSTIHELKLNKRLVEDIQAFSMGDSIFLSYSTGSIHHNYIFSNDGVKSEFEFGLDNASLIFCGAARNEQGIYYYALAGSRVLLVTNERQPLDATRILFRGKVLGWWAENHLYVVTYEDDQRLLTLTEARKSLRNAFDFTNVDQVCG